MTGSPRRSEGRFVGEGEAGPAARFAKLGGTGAAAVGADGEVDVDVAVGVGEMEPWRVVLEGDLEVSLEGAPPGRGEHLGCATCGIRVVAGFGP